MIYKLHFGKCYNRLEFGFDKDYKQFPCRCGAKNCCGWIVRAESRWRINKKFSMANKKKLINNFK